jgi:hypothetical protein
VVRHRHGDLSPAFDVTYSYSPSGAWKWIPLGAGSQCAEPVVDPVGSALVVPPVDPRLASLRR